MAKGLTTRQEAILQFVLEYVQEIGYPPSIREIGDKFKIGSLRGVTVHLDALKKKGYIERSNTPRSIRIIHPAYQTGQRVTMLPLLGQIAAGAPILADEHGGSEPFAVLEYALDADETDEVLLVNLASDGSVQSVMSAD